MNEPKYKRLDVSKLKPTESRLLNAAFSMQPGDSYLELMERSGIRECKKFVAVYKRLKALGFFYVYEGNEYPRLYVEEPIERRTESVATIPYPGTITHITKAKQ